MFKELFGFCNHKWELERKAELVSDCNRYARPVGMVYYFICMKCAKAKAVTVDA